MRFRSVARSFAGAVMVASTVLAGAAATAGATPATSGAQAASRASTARPTGATPAGATQMGATPTGATQTATAAPNRAPGTTGMALQSGSAALRGPKHAAAQASGVSNQQSPPPVPGNDLIQGAGQIMKNPVIYNVFWLPAGQHFEATPNNTPAGDTSYQNLLNRWATDVGAGNNDFYNIVTQYPGSNGTPANSASFGGGWVDTTAYPHAGTQGDPISDQNIQDSATRAATTNGWTRDINHIYLVYTATNIFQCQTASSDCNFFKTGHTNAYCAYHTYFGSPPNETIYAFMGSDGQAGGGCDNGVAPNGDAFADAETSSASHEFIESVTDPHIDNWLSSAATGSQEIGDLCNRNDGPHNLLAPGADVYLNGNPYDIQSEWSNAVHACAMDLNGAKNNIVPPVLALTKSATANVVTGQPINYTLQVTNPSNTDASTQTIVTDPLPAGVTYKPFSASPGPSSVSPLTWNLGTIAVHDSVTITFQATSNPQSVNNCAGGSYSDALQITTNIALPAPCAATTITRAATTTAVTSDINPSVFGQTVTLKATVSVNAPGSGIPSGVVNFFDGGNPLGAGTLNGANPPVTTIAVSSLSVGSHVITAQYSGDSSFTASTSLGYTQTVNKAATTTVVVSNHNPSVFGQPVTFTATVTANPPGAGTPSGNLQFLDGATPIGSGTLVAGSFSITTAALSVGTHPITAHYGGDGSFLASGSTTLSQIVNKAPTTTSLTANPAGSVGFGHAVTFTATVSVPPPGAGNPTGPVIFSVDGTPVQTVNLNASEQASVTTSALSPGSHLISAAYQGDGNFLASSGTLNYLVTCTVTVTGNHPGALIASGDSTCVVNATLGGSITVSPGTSLAVINSTVHGSINATNTPNAIEVCGAHIVGGSINVVNAGGLVIVGDPGDANCAVNTISGTLLLRNNTHGVEAIGNTVGGLVISGNSGPGPFPGDATTISGNIISH